MCSYAIDFSIIHNNNKISILNRRNSLCNDNFSNPRNKFFKSFALDSTTTNGTDTALSTIANISEDFKTIEVLTDGKRNKIPETVKTNTKLKILKNRFKNIDKTFKNIKNSLR